jgi:hypothetical protein
MTWNNLNFFVDVSVGFFSPSSSESDDCSLQSGSGSISSSGSNSSDERLEDKFVFSTKISLLVALRETFATHGCAAVFDEVADEFFVAWVELPRVVAVVRVAVGAAVGDGISKLAGDSQSFSMLGALE